MWKASIERLSGQWMDSAQFFISPIARTIDLTSSYQCLFSCHNLYSASLSFSCPSRIIRCSSCLEDQFEDGWTICGANHPILCNHFTNLLPVQVHVDSACWSTQSGLLAWLLGFLLAFCFDLILPTVLLSIGFNDWSWFKPHLSVLLSSPDRSPPLLYRKASHPDHTFLLFQSLPLLNSMEPIQ